jgi:methenyltetrahydrofolate cyclohydrolase
MPPSASLLTTSIENFRDRVASTEPTPAGVSVAAISASLGLALIEKVLRIVSQRKGFAGDRARLGQLADAAQAGSARVVHYADEDVAVFNEYLASRRAKDARATGDALRNAIEVPLKIARSAVDGLDLCAAAAGFAHAPLAADLGAAAEILAGAVRATLLSVDSNVTQLALDNQLYGDILAERRQLQKKAEEKAGSIAQGMLNRISNAP